VDLQITPGSAPVTIVSHPEAVGYRRFGRSLVAPIVIDGDIHLARGKGEIDGFLQ
jgi:hypothetical protein